MPLRLPVALNQSGGLQKKKQKKKTENTTKNNNKKRVKKEALKTDEMIILQQRRQRSVSALKRCSFLVFPKGHIDWLRAQFIEEDH